MKEILCVQIGQCGNQIGTQFWEQISSEHRINSNGSLYGDSNIPIQKINTYFNESSSGSYHPRAIIIDLDPNTISLLKISMFGKLFNPANIILGKLGTGNNWATGHYTIGKDLIQRALDAIRKEAENCDNLQGFQFTHSLGGGTGSGFGCLLLSKLKEEYPDKLIQDFPLFPSLSTSNVLAEPYNTVLSIPSLIECADLTHIIDNEALYDICLRELHLSTPPFGTLNQIASSLMADITCPLRFSGEQTMSLRELAVNLIPFSRLHFFTIGRAPLVFSAFRAYTLSELIQEMLDAKNMLCDFNLSKGKYLSAQAIFRGKNSTKEGEDRMLYAKSTMNFIDWSSTNTKTYFCNEPPIGLKKSATFIGNSTSIIELFKKILIYFTPIFNRKSYVHWFTNEGMDILELSEAETNINDLISEYNQYQEPSNDLIYE